MIIRQRHFIFYSLFLLLTDVFQQRFHQLNRILDLLTKCLQFRLYKVICNWVIKSKIRKCQETAYFHLELRRDLHASQSLLKIRQFHSGLLNQSLHFVDFGMFHIRTDQISTKDVQNSPFLRTI